MTFDVSRGEAGRVWFVDGVPVSEAVYDALRRPEGERDGAGLSRREALVGLENTKAWLARHGRPAARPANPNQGQ